MDERGSSAVLVVLLILLKGRRSRIEWNVAADASSEAESPPDNELRPIDSNVRIFLELEFSGFRGDWGETVFKSVCVRERGREWEREVRSQSV